MSIKESILRITPPFDGTDSEVHKYEGIICPNCGGSGEIKIFQDYFQIDEPEIETCQRCDGSGNLKAKVVVEWEADK